MNGNTTQIYKKDMFLAYYVPRNDSRFCRYLGMLWGFPALCIGKKGGKQGKWISTKNKDVVSSIQYSNCKNRNIPKKGKTKRIIPFVPVVSRCWGLKGKRKAKKQQRNVNCEKKKKIYYIWCARRNFRNNAILSNLRSTHWLHFQTDSARTIHACPPILGTYDMVIIKSF